MFDVNAEERAKEYVGDIRWRLEVMQYRSRYNMKTGEYKKLPTRVRRFSNGIPTDIVSYVLEELNRTKVFTGLVFNGEEVEGKYRTSSSQIRKDDSLKTGGDATYTIIQDLLLCGEPDVYEFGDSSACSGVSTSEYRWDEAEVEACPDGGQGVTYRIVDVQRDSSTDLFSYRVQKNVAVTQHLPAVTSECSDDSTTTVELWDNLYGEPGDWHWDSVVHGGKAAKIPAPCSESKGNLVSIDYSENDDCTFKVRVTRRTSKASGTQTAGAEFLRIRDRYQRKTMDLVKNAVTHLPYEGVEYKDGVITQYESVENDDQTWNNRVTVTTEREVKMSEYEYRVSPRFTQKTWTDTNVPDAATGIPEGFSYGSYKTTKTPGGLYTNEYSGYVPNLETFGYSCEDTAYLHTHVNESTVDDADFPGEGEHVAAAADGVVNSESYQKDESTGLVTKRSTVREEHAVEWAKRKVTSGLLGRMVEYTNRSWTSPLTEPALGGGTFASSEYTVTDGYRYDVSWSEFEKAPAGAVVGTECSKTAFAHVDQKETTADEVGECVEEAGGGVYRRRVFSVDTQTGVVRQTETLHEELAFENAVVTKTNTPKAVVTKTTDRNVTGPASELLGRTLSTGASERVSTNDGKSVDVERTTVAANVGAVLRNSCQVDASSHTHQKDTVVNASSPSASASAGKGVYRQEEVSLDDQGVATKRSTETTEYEHEFGVRINENAVEAYQVVENTSSDVNVGDPAWPKGAGFEAKESGSTRGSASSIASARSPFNDKSTSAKMTYGVTRPSKAQIAEFITTEKLASGGGFARGRQIITDSELTKGGRFRTKEHRYVAKPQKWLDDISSDTYHKYVWHFRNLTQAQVEEIVKDVVQASAKENTGDNNVHPFINRELNNYGLFDGTAGYEESHARAAWKTTGGGHSESDDIEEVAFQQFGTWKEKLVSIQPVTQLNPYAADYVGGVSPMFVAKVTWTTYKGGYGVGKGSFASAISSLGSGGKMWASPSISFDVSTQQYKIVAAVEQKTSIEVIVGSGTLPQPGQPLSDGKKLVSSASTDSMS
jgi:hypothetical protein